MKMNLNIKNNRWYVLGAVIIIGIALYFYLGLFFQTGVDYYGHFMRENQNKEESGIEYVGTTSMGKTSIRLITMKETDKLIEITSGEISRVYMMESSSDGEKIRLFDGTNSLVFKGFVNREMGTILPRDLNELSISQHVSLGDNIHSVENPDPIVLVMLANRLNERYRGNLTTLMFAALILISLIVDMLFPKFFFRMKNLKFRGEIEIPAMYVRMQRYSWLFSPVIIIFFLYMAI